MKSFSEIEEICGKYGIENYTINEDGSIDVDGEVYLESFGLNELPLNFNRVSGDFYCGHNELTTLKGSPKYVGDGFYCNNNSLTSLEFSPIEVKITFNCSRNKLTSLEFSPKKVGSTFYCENNEIRDLYGISDYIGGILFCEYENPIGSIVDKPTNIDFVRAFNVYKVIKDDKVHLKRLKYVMETFNMEYDLDKIKKYYTFV